MVSVHCTPTPGALTNSSAVSTLSRPLPLQPKLDITLTLNASSTRSPTLGLTGPYLVQQRDQKAAGDRDGHKQGKDQGGEPGLKRVSLLLVPYKYEEWVKASGEEELSDK